MEINIGMKHSLIVKLRDELNKAIEGNPEGRDGGTEVILYGRLSDDSAVGTLTINNDDMEREEVTDDTIYAEVD